LAELSHPGFNRIEKLVGRRLRGRQLDRAVRDADSRALICLVECAEGSKLIPISMINRIIRRHGERLMSYGSNARCRDNIRSPQDALQWTLGPIALQRYAKVGGTPWRLPATQSVDSGKLLLESEIGLNGQILVRAEQSRVVGITTLSFLGDGSYMLGERLPKRSLMPIFLLNSSKGSQRHRLRQCARIRVERWGIPCASFSTYLSRSKMWRRCRGQS